MSRSTEDCAHVRSRSINKVSTEFFVAGAGSANRREAGATKRNASAIEAMTRLMDLPPIIEPLDWLTPPAQLGNHRRARAIDFRCLARHHVRRSSMWDR